MNLTILCGFCDDSTRFCCLSRWQHVLHALHSCLHESYFCFQSILLVCYLLSQEILKFLVHCDQFISWGCTATTDLPGISELSTLVLFHKNIPTEFLMFHASVGKANVSSSMCQCHHFIVIFYRRGKENKNSLFSKCGFFTKIQSIGFD